MNNRKNKKYLTYLGFAVKSRKCGIGTFACETELGLKKTKLLLCSALASVRTQKKFEELCKLNNIPFRLVDDDLGLATGRNGTYVYSVSDKQLSDAIINNLDAYVTLGVQGLDE